LARDEKFNNVDVLSFGYESECGPSANIREIANHLHSSLEAALEKPYQSIAFVAHSMGGLVVREFILSHWNKLNVPIDSVVMLSTPNLGNSIANLAKYFCSSDALGDLRSGKNSYLDALNDRWREKFKQQGSSEPFHFSAGYELVPILLTGIIVEKDSAVAFSQQILSFKKDHSTIAKPLGISDPVYIWVKQRLLQESQVAKGFSEEEEKRYTETIEKLQKELQGTDLESALNLIAEEQLDEALTLLSKKETEENEEVVKISRARFAKAQVYALKLDYNNSLKCYEKAVQLAPENALYLNDAGFMLATLAQYDKAIEYYEKALKVFDKAGQPQNAKVVRGNIAILKNQR
jgi:tetratricopeptide (TPR) repeat protein